MCHVVFSPVTATVVGLTSQQARRQSISSLGFVCSAGKLVSALCGHKDVRFPFVAGAQLKAASSEKYFLFNKREARGNTLSSEALEILIFFL